MAIDLTIFERGEPFIGDLAVAVADLQRRLSALQMKQIVHRRRAIIVIEGSEGGGKNDFLRLLGAAFDPGHVTVTNVAPDRRREGDGHWLARFWARLPEAGITAIFHHSWYRRVLEDRLLGSVGDKEWTRAFDEINEFESQQRDYGTAIVKLLFHVTDQTQDRRIAERQADEWRRHLIGSAELRTPPARAAYRAAVGEMLEQTDTRWAPWSMIDANDRGSSLVAALTAIADGLEKALPQSPPEVANAAVPFMAASDGIQPVG